MRLIGVLLLAVLVASATAQQPAIRWEPTGGPPIPDRREVVAMVMSAATAPWGGVFVADGYALFAAKDKGAWQKLIFSREPGLNITSTYAVIVTSRGDVLAYVSGHGVMRSRDRGETWRRVGLTQYVHAFIETKSGSILAGTEDGIFRSSDDGESWNERSIGLSERMAGLIQFRIPALAAAADGTVYAATWEGDIFRSTDDGDRWRPLGEYRGGYPSRALVALRNGDVLAGGSRLARWDAAARSWHVIQRSMDPRTAEIRALVQNERGVVFAATNGDGVLASFDGGNTWQSANEGLTTKQVLTLAVDAQGRLFAGTPFSGVFRASSIGADVPRQ